MGILNATANGEAVSLDGDEAVSRRFHRDKVAEPVEIIKCITSPLHVVYSVP